MDDHAVLDHLERAVDALEDRREELANPGCDPGGLVPLSEVMARVMAKLDALRVR